MRPGDDPAGRPASGDALVAVGFLLAAFAADCGFAFSPFFASAAAEDDFSARGFFALFFWAGVASRAGGCFDLGSAVFERPDGGEANSPAGDLCGGPDFSRAACFLSGERGGRWEGGGSDGGGLDGGGLDGGAAEPLTSFAGGADSRGADSGGPAGAGCEGGCAGGCAGGCDRAEVDVADVSGFEGGGGAEGIEPLAGPVAVGVPA